MTRSLFDPTGPDAEHSGTRNLGPDAANISHMPSDVTDDHGDVDSEIDQDNTTGEIARAEDEVE